MGQAVEDTITSVARRRGEFRPEAYFFTLDALNSTVERLSVRRHLSGPEVLDGVVRLANRRFGDQAADILHRWGISSTRDVGVIIYDLIEAGILSKTEDDELDDFDGVFDLPEALQEESWRQRWRIGNEEDLDLFGRRD
jgi:uncharacterized repeat protein (TIGR04138 family)